MAGAIAERLGRINERLRGIHQVLDAWALRATIEGGR